MNLSLLAEIHSPEGPAFRFFVLAFVIVVAPKIATRLHIPGMVGLLIGGMLVGPYVFDWITKADTDIASLGQIGLLYLMFLAGLELDLNLFNRHRKAAITFALLTFGFPMLFGWGSAAIVGFSLGASLLLGSMWASHTLVVYPQVRDMGLARDPAVAATVGATVITDTLALVVLAVVAGTAAGSGDVPVIVGELVVGFALLLVVGFIVIPRVVRIAFARYAPERTVRFMIVMASFLGLAMLGDMFGIEPIVGAFFAGLALNRLVPNSGMLMERIEFFGSALFIPAFLVSVGLLIDPSVMVELETLGLALVFMAACYGGKVAAALVTKRLYGYTRAEAGVVLSLSLAQAAATLAAAFVGLEVGLLTERVVNATLVVVVVSLIVAPLLATVFGKQVPQLEDEERALGNAVVVGVGRIETLPALSRCAAAFARIDAGVVMPIRIVTPDDPPAETEQLREAADRLISAEGIDAEMITRIDDSIGLGLARAAATRDASLIVVGWEPVANAEFRGVLARPSSDLTVPLVFIARAPAVVRRCIVVVDTQDLQRSHRITTMVAGELARRIAGDHLVVYASGDRVAKVIHRVFPAVEVHDVATRDLAAIRADLQDGDLVVLPATRSWATLDAEVESLAEHAGVMVVARPGATGAGSGPGGGLWAVAPGPSIDSLARARRRRVISVRVVGQQRARRARW